MAAPLAVGAAPAPLAAAAADAARDEASSAAAAALGAASDIGFTSTLETGVSGAVIYDQIKNFANVSDSDEKMQQTYRSAKYHIFRERYNHLLVMTISSMSITSKAKICD